MPRLHNSRREHKAYFNRKVTAITRPRETAAVDETIYRQSAGGQLCELLESLRPPRDICVTVSSETIFVVVSTRSGILVAAGRIQPTTNARDETRRGDCLRGLLATMKPSPSYRAQGFLRRSLDEFKRLSIMALTGEGTRSPTVPYVLALFHDPESPKTCKVMSDADAGGFTRVNLDWVPPSPNPDPPKSENPNGHVRFHGKISTELPVNRPHILRTGYAAWRTLDRGRTIFGKSLWDIDRYAYLALRVKSDGRKYFVNVQTESVVPTDIHQHRLYARRPGEWETIMINWNEFVRTNHGIVVEPQSELLRQKVRTIGIGLIDRIPGDFDLSIERIWATNHLSKRDKKEDERGEEGQLKRQHGDKIRWGEGRGERGERGEKGEDEELVKRKHGDKMIRIKATRKDGREWEKRREGRVWREWRDLLKGKQHGGIITRRVMGKEERKAWWSNNMSLK
ncbi:hypothetical protein B7494_g3500 [Chlorociboria aeruginascens]|nr:hypothetical protein B7494_g3500 [Chlorociboria aeruginascens]